MAQVFHRSTNTIAKASLYGSAVVAGLALWAVLSLDRSAYITKQGVVQKQPVPFSHRHHVAGLGLDCRYCHTGVEDTAFAGIPPIQTCMNCHSQIWTNAPVLEPIREAWRTGVPVQWQRVNDLPDYVYFNHSIHVAKGVGCVTCHGAVNDMPLMFAAQTLRMEWCLSCHRDPARFVRPKEEVFNWAYEPSEPQAQLGARLVAEGGIQKLTNCSVCHR